MDKVATEKHVRLDGHRNGEPAVPARLLVSPWEARDQVIREFQFDNVAEYNHRKRVIEETFIVSRWNYCVSWVPFGVGILCLPFSQTVVPKIFPTCRGVGEYDEYQESENMMEDIYSRRAAITKKGVLFKRLKRHRVGVPPGELCNCWTKPERSPEFQLTEDKNFVSFALIEDEELRVEPPTGGFRGANVCCCRTGKFIPYVESQIEGFKASWKFNGLAAPNAFVETILAVKHGKPMPPIDRGGILDFSAGIPSPDDATIAPHVSRNVHAASASRQQEIRSQISRFPE